MAERDVGKTQLNTHRTCKEGIGAGAEERWEGLRRGEVGGADTQGEEIQIDEKGANTKGKGEWLGLRVKVLCDIPFLSPASPWETADSLF